MFLGRTVHTHGKIKGWGKLLKKKPPPFRITKRVSELFRKTENAVVPFCKRDMSDKTVVAGKKWAKERVLRYYDDYMIEIATVKERQSDDSVKTYMDGDLKQEIALTLLEEIPNFLLKEAEKIAKEKTEMEAG